MNPKITVKFRRRNGVPYAIEQFTGKQFRCRHCNKVFLEISELERHIAAVTTTSTSAHIPIAPSVPQLNQMLDVRIGYVYDSTDFLKRKYLKLKKGETYDGIVVHTTEEQRA